MSNNKYSHCMIFTDNQHGQQALYVELHNSLLWCSGVLWICLSVIAIKFRPSSGRPLTQTHISSSHPPGAGLGRGSLWSALSSYQPGVGGGFPDLPGLLGGGLAPTYHLKILPNQFLRRVTTCHVHICILVLSFNRWPYQSIPVSVVFINTAWSYGPAISNFMETTKDRFPVTKDQFLPVNSPVVHFRVTIWYVSFSRVLLHSTTVCKNVFTFPATPSPFLPLHHYLFSGYPDPPSPFGLAPTYHLQSLPNQFLRRVTTFHVHICILVLSLLLSWLYQSIPVSVVFIKLWATVVVNVQELASVLG